MWKKSENLKIQDDDVASDVNYVVVVALETNYQVNRMNDVKSGGERSDCPPPPPIPYAFV